MRFPIRSVTEASGSGGMCGSERWARVNIGLRASDQNADDENERAADQYLKRRHRQRRLHEAPADPGNHRELDRDHGEGKPRRRPKMRNEIWQRMTEAAERGHRAADDAANDRVAAAGERAVIRKRLG